MSPILESTRKYMSKGIKGFERYVAMAIASRNTQIIGGFKLSRLKKKFKIAA